METRIGIAAGVVWGHLAEHGPTTVPQLKRATKLADSLLLMALGWLAREGKVVFEETKKGLRIALARPSA